VKLRPGTTIVLEGLDRSGKSTQRSALQLLPWADPAPTFTHMPSGLSPLTEKIYGLTEHEKFTSDLGRQLAHLTCHAENIGRLSEARTSGLILDRWWWSTVAYGWYGGGLQDSVSRSLFFGLIDTIWAHFTADLVFLFMTPFENDALNRDAVIRGYEALASEHQSTTVRVPRLSPADTTSFLRESLRERGLLVPRH